MKNVDFFLPLNAFLSRWLKIDTCLFNKDLSKLLTCWRYVDLIETIDLNGKMSTSGNSTIF